MIQEILLNPKCLNILGLSLDIFGVVLVWKFGLPNRLKIIGGHAKKICGIPIHPQEDEGQRRTYGWLEKAGLSFLIAGFSFQIFSNIL